MQAEFCQINYLAITNVNETPATRRARFLRSRRSLPSSMGQTVFEQYLINIMFNQQVVIDNMVVSNLNNITINCRNKFTESDAVTKITKVYSYDDTSLTIKNF